MKTLKLALGAFVLSCAVLTACEKQTTTDAPTRAQEPSTFILATEQEAAKAEIELQQILDGNIETVVVVDEKAAAAATACCLNKSLTKVVGPTINLNLQYDVSNPSQVVQIKHWVDQGAGYVYQGQDNIATSYTTCTSKGVNLGTNHIPSGTIISWSRIWDADASTYCGGSQTLTWTK